ncbi:MAG: aspartate aminotransferase family protein, partial [Chloroflexota bacterium]
LQGALRRHGLIVRASNDGIAIAPPLIITQAQCDEIVSAIAASLAEVLG